MDYKEALKSPKWEDKRQGILKRDNYSCRRCGERAQAVHHRYYLSVGTMPWEYPDSALLSLCNRCHTREHKIKPLSDFLYIPEQYLQTINFPDPPIIRGPRKQTWYKQTAKVSLKVRIAALQKSAEESKKSQLKYEKYCEELHDLMLKSVSHLTDVLYFTNRGILRGLNLQVFKFLLDNEIPFFYFINAGQFIPGATPKMVDFYLPETKVVILDNKADFMTIKWCSTYRIQTLNKTEALKRVDLLKNTPYMPNQNKSY